MKTQGQWRVAVSGLILALCTCLVACAPAKDIATSTTTQVATSTPTNSPFPTRTETPTLTPTATAEPTETEILAAEPTKKEEPSAEPTAEPTKQPTPEPTEQPPTAEPTEVVDNVDYEREVTIEGQGEFMLVDPDPGELLGQFGSQPSEMGWAQTSEGEWVVFDKVTQMTIKTLPKSEVDRLGLSPRVEKKEGFVDGEKQDELNLYGFFVGHEIRTMVLNPGDQNPQTDRFSIFKFLIPNEQGGTIAEAFVFNGLVERKFVLALEFRQPSRTEKAAGVVTVDEGLSILSVGDTVKCSIPFSIQLISRGDKKGLPLEQNIRLFVENHPNMENNAFNQYNQGENRRILFGTTSWINYFPAP